MRVDITENWITHSMTMQSPSSTVALAPLAEQKFVCTTAN